MRPSILCLSLLLAGACAGGPVDEMTLESELDDDAGKDDSVAGRRIRHELGDLIRVVPGPIRSNACSRSGDGPWMCGDGIAYIASTTVLGKDDESIALRGNLVEAADDLTLHRVEAYYNTYNAYVTAWPKRVGQLLFARAEGAEWTQITCPGTSYWPARVLVDSKERKVTSLGNQRSRSLEGCTAPAGPFAIASLPIPTSDWFGLDGSYPITVYINQSEHDFN